MYFRGYMYLPLLATHKLFSWDTRVIGRLSATPIYRTSAHEERRDITSSTSTLWCNTTRYLGTLKTKTRPISMGFRITRDFFWTIIFSNKMAELADTGCHLATVVAALLLSLPVSWTAIALPVGTMMSHRVLCSFCKHDEIPTLVPTPLFGHPIIGRLCPFQIATSLWTVWLTVTKK